MTFAPLTNSTNVIDLRAMLHLMPEDYQAAMFQAHVQGATAGACMAFGLAYLTATAILIWKGKRQ